MLLVISPARAGEPLPLDVYGGLPGVEDMALSPSGSSLAVVGRINGERRFLILDAQRRPVTNGVLGDMKLRYIRWMGEDRLLIVTSNTEDLGMDFTADKVELYTGILVSLKGEKPVVVFGGRPGLIRAIFGDYGTRVIDGKWMSFFGGIELGRSSDLTGYRFVHGRPALFSLDVASNRPAKIGLAPPEGHWRRWLVDDRGAVTATLDINHGTGIWEITNARGARIASGVDPTGDVDLISLGRDGSTVIYAIDDDKQVERSWIEVPIAGGTARPFLDGIDVERVYVDPANGRMLGYLPKSGDPKPVLFDPKQQAILAKVYRAFPKLDVRIVEWTPNFSHFLVHTSGNGDSGTWLVVDLASHRADPVGYDYVEIAEKAVGAISTVDYKAADGLDLDGILTLPPGREAHNLPVVMLPHGGPHTHDKKQFDWWAQAFASRGYAVFQPNFRGSTNRDESFRRAAFGQWGRKMQTDISDGLAELGRRGIVDPRRACIVGASYGGYAALAGVTLQHGLYRCAVAVAPVSDLDDMYTTENRESGGNHAVKLSLRESLGNPSSFAAVSPRRKAAQADAPILLVHGKDDTVVPFRQSTAMADALKDAGKPYELVVLKEEDHWLSRIATRRQMLEAAVGFVQRYNPAN